jgi:hypothetical protein
MKTFTLRFIVSLKTMFARAKKVEAAETEHDRWMNLQW